MPKRWSGSWAWRSRARAEYLRVIWHELSRVHSHILWMGLAADAFGYESLFMHCWRLRERVLDIFEKTTGGRVIFSVVKVGGVVRDIDAAQMAEIKRVLEGIKEDYRQICDAFSEGLLREEPHGGRGAPSATRTRWRKAWWGRSRAPPT